MNEQDINTNIDNEPEEKVVKDFSDYFADDPEDEEDNLSWDSPFMSDEQIKNAIDWRWIARKNYESRFDYDDSTRLDNAEFDVRMLLQFSERQARKIKELERRISAAQISYDRMSRDLDEAMYKCHLYEDIAKDKAKRARKLPKDHTGYLCLGSREVIDKYEFMNGPGRISQSTTVGYRTTFAMPYPSALGYDELRRLLEIDLVHGGKEGLYSIPGMGYVMGIDRIIEGLPNNGKHPGPEELCYINQSPECVLYRVTLNIGKRYAEADLYTTAPLVIPPEYYSYGQDRNTNQKRKG